MARLASAEGGNFFFHPVQLKFEPADLFVKRRLQRLGVLPSSFTPLSKNLPAVFPELFLPEMNLARMNLVVTGQFASPTVFSPLSASRATCNLNSGVCLCLPFMLKPLRCSGLKDLYSRLSFGPFFGVHYIKTRINQH